MDITIAEELLMMGKPGKLKIIQNYKQNNPVGEKTNGELR